MKYQMSIRILDDMYINISYFYSVCVCVCVRYSLLMCNYYVLAIKRKKGKTPFCSKNETILCLNCKAFCFNFYLLIWKSELVRERQKDRSFICWFAPQMAAASVLGQAKAKTQELALSAFPYVRQGP